MLLVALIIFIYLIYYLIVYHQFYISELALSNNVVYFKSPCGKYPIACLANPIFDKSIEINLKIPLYCKVHRLFSKHPFCRSLPESGLFSMLTEC